MNSMTTKPIVEQAELTQGELDRIQRFEADYNAVDDFLRNNLGIDRNLSFHSVVNQYMEKNHAWNDGKLLHMIADLRNVIVHGKKEPYEYAAVPTPAIVRKLELARERLLNPRRAIPTFSHTVEKVSLSESLLSVLKIIEQSNYSQFPAYDHDTFKGLITENGITRWLAKHVSTKSSIVDLGDVTVEQVLPSEETKASWTFVRCDTPVDDVKYAFAENKLLEAVLITETGNETEKLMGIATRWDILT